MLRAALLTASLLLVSGTFAITSNIRLDNDPCDNAGQQWTWKSNAPPGRGQLTFSNVLDSSQCLSFARLNGTDTLITRRCSKWDTRLIFIRNVTDHTLRPASQPTLCVTKTVVHANIVLAPCDGSGQQEWSFTFTCPGSNSSLNIGAISDANGETIMYTPGVISSAAQLPSGILDGHVHLTNTSVINYPWAKPNAGVCPCAPPCLCNWTLTDFAAVTSPSPIAPSKVVFVEVGANSTDWLTEATWVASIAGSSSGYPYGNMVGAIIAQQPPGFGDPSVPPAAMASLLDSLVAVGPLVHGIRAGGVAWADPAAWPAILAHASLLVARNLSLDVVTSVTDPAVAGAVAALAQQLPGLTIVLDHCGGPAVLGNASQAACWSTSMSTLGSSSLPNVYVKLGGIMQGYKGGGVLPTATQLRPWVSHVLASFPYSRIVYEGNWFFCNWGSPDQPNLSIYWLWAGHVLAFLDEAGAGEVDRAEVFWGAGARAYRVQ